MVNGLVEVFYRPEPWVEPYCALAQISGDGVSWAGYGWTPLDAVEDALREIMGRLAP